MVDGVVGHDFTLNPVGPELRERLASGFIQQDQGFSRALARGAGRGCLALEQQAVAEELAADEDLDLLRWWYRGGRRDLVGPGPRFRLLEPLSERAGF